jgi:hypothetical protein
VALYYGRGLHLHDRAPLDVEEAGAYVGLSIRSCRRSGERSREWGSEPDGTQASEGTSAELRADAEAGFDLGDALVVPNNPVAPAELGSRPPMFPRLDLSRGELGGDSLVLVEVALETLGR